MNTPICDFVDRYIREDVLRLHMPGHKGVGALEKRDITEVTGADVLYSASGIIGQSQENAASLFGAGRTLYSAEGSSLSIRAMVYLLWLYAGKRPVIAAGRNAHKTFVTAAALLDADVRWLYPSHATDALSCQITAEELEMFLRRQPVTAVYLTSPDYLGNMADLGALARVCHSHGALLLVDNAHGAYLRFLGKSLHPMDLGADMCCDSAHKTLPVLTGGAYLHISKTAPAALGAQAEQAMSLFASTSPSYLILQSLDRCNRYLAEDYRAQLARLTEQVTAMKERLLDRGYSLAGTEATKVTVMPKAYGCRADRLAELLEGRNMRFEFFDPDYLVMMLTPQSGDQALRTAEEALLSIPRQAPITDRMPPMGRPEQVMSCREALMRAGKRLPLRQCLGKILASPTVSCPPAVPILVCGERVDESALAVMEYYGVETLDVL